mmetsp:Transcript_17908/g.53927  ORF Transcript_17908/g.53927 Transcript_17908/m.53927 type:complete len:356 (+) Transcript_17908:391-1458(+)
MAGLSPKLLADGAVWASNISSAVGIIFVNKLLMSRTGYGFRFATTLCAAHYLLCAGSFWATQSLGFIKKAKLPLTDLILFVSTANTSIVTLNLSLLLNKVGIYQISKLLNIPFVALVEAFWLGKRFSGKVICTMAVVVVGVAIVTVSDTELDGNVVGILVALVAVASSGMQQIFCRSMQQKHGLSSHELLSSTAPSQGWSLLMIGPFLDYYVVGQWLLDYQWTRAAMVTFAASCTLAIGVNLSQFMCLGRFTAISYQVLGHGKTALVLFGGWAFLGEEVTMRQVCGMLLAMCGMIGYGYFISQEAQAEAPKSPPKKGDLAPQKLPSLNGDGLKAARAGDEETASLLPLSDKLSQR